MTQIAMKLFEEDSGDIRLTFRLPNSSDFNFGFGRSIVNQRVKRVRAAKKISSNVRESKKFSNGILILIISSYVIETMP